MCSQSDEQISQGQAAVPFHLADRELLCKKQCGFYGTPQCKGLCSQCWRDYQLDSKRLNDYQNNIKVLRQHQHDNNSSGGGGGESSAAAAGGGCGGAASAPSSAPPVRKSSDVRFNSLKTFLKKSPSVFSASTYATEPNSSVTLGIRAPSPDSLQAQEHLDAFLDANFPPAFAKELDKQCQMFIDNVFKHELLPSEELSLLVQAFYQSIKERALKIVAQLSPNTAASFSLSDFMTGIENYVCTRAYPVLFGSRSEEEAEDLSLQTRIRSLHWVTNGFLETALDESSGQVFQPNFMEFDHLAFQVQEFLNEAITEIVDLNSHRPVTKKLDCLVRCSKDIFDALKESRSGAPASADEFLPVLILITLRANPPLIQSNLKFISRFGLPSRHMRGEYGYYYTNLSSAIYFIQDMNANSLQISEEEFEGYMSGTRIPPPRNSISTSVVRSFENSLHKLDKLKQAAEALNRSTDTLEAAMNSDLTSFMQRIREVVEDDGEITEDLKNKIELLCHESANPGEECKDVQRRPADNSD
uniref:VPS9 domain-containing protein n=1 Tax=Globodera pallida TaxID=36090 RepID=A0A183BNM4_GLOPA